MKTINVYTFSELSAKAKEKALENWNCSKNNTYFCGDDAIKSLEKFVAYFGGELLRYSIDFLEPAHNEYNINYLEHEDITKTELKNLIKGMGSYDKKTLRGNGDCILTGVDSDENLFDGARKAYFSGERDIEKIINEGIKFWEKACQEDYEYQYTEEFFSEHSEINDMNFFEDGKLAPRTK